MSYSIDPTKCVGCHTCQAMCPMGAISVDVDGKCKIDPTKCACCGTCANACPVNAIS